MSAECPSDVIALCTGMMASDTESSAEGGASQARFTEAGFPDVSVESQLGEPAHHARRPMNAFLIFCKRHRGVVRDRYPHLENRSITKILGEWWANLELQEKASYTELARQYKEAFLRANPDFKWYKLPAPPLRTLMTRPSNQNKPHKLECQLTCGPITPGKLADESQMGGLSSLLASLPNSTPTTPAPSLPTSPTVPKPPKKRYLQETKGLLDGSLAPPRYNLPSEKNDTGQNVLTEQTNTDNITSENTEYTNLSSLDSIKTATASFTSPFTKLRSHAANQLNSIQERKSSERRNSSEQNNNRAREVTGKTKARARKSPSSPLLVQSEKSAVQEKSCPSSETTIEASQQEIIDRVVDRLCGLVESPPSAERQLSTATSSHDCHGEKAQTFVSLPTKRPAKKEVTKAVHLNKYKKLVTHWPADENTDSEMKSNNNNNNNNNNNYVDKSVSTLRHKDTCVTDANCKTMECVGNTNSFVKLPSPDISSDEKDADMSDEAALTKHYDEIKEENTFPLDVSNATTVDDDQNECKTVSLECSNHRCVSDNQDKHTIWKEVKSHVATHVPLNSLEHDKEMECVSPQVIKGGPITGNNYSSKSLFNNDINLPEEECDSKYKNSIPVEPIADASESVVSSASPVNDSIVDISKHEIVQNNLRHIVIPSNGSSCKQMAVTRRRKGVQVDGATSKTQNGDSVSEEDLPAISTGAGPEAGGQSNGSEVMRRKSLRTCKGLRYREFMSEGRLTAGKRNRRNTNSNFDGEQPRDSAGSEPSSVSERADSVFSECFPEPEVDMSDKAQAEAAVRPSGMRDGVQPPTADKKVGKHSETSQDSSSPKKMFRAADFNLDEKIEALPSLSLEDFQLKKKAKKKRTLTSVKKTSSSNTSIASVKSETKKAVPSAMLADMQVPETSLSNDRPQQKTVLVGSQKRKARKQSITRLDTDNARARRDTAVVEPDVLNNIGLATLAEVASAKSKMAK